MTRKISKYEQNTIDANNRMKEAEDNFDWSKFWSDVEAIINNPVLKEYHLFQYMGVNFRRDREYSQLTLMRWIFDWKVANYGNDAWIKLEDEFAKVHESLSWEKQKDWITHYIEVHFFRHIHWERVVDTPEITIDMYVSPEWGSSDD
jgi:hypothetical protein